MLVRHMTAVMFARGVSHEDEPALTGRRSKERPWPAGAAMRTDATGIPRTRACVGCTRRPSANERMRRMYAAHLPCAKERARRVYAHAFREGTRASRRQQ